MLSEIDEAEIREQFMSVVYDELASDGTNDRANRIIYEFDTAMTAIIDRLAGEQTVVRCAECRKRGKENCPMYNRESWVIWTEDNTYCSYGERRKETDDG